MKVGFIGTFMTHYLYFLLSFIYISVSQLANGDVFVLEMDCSFC